MNITTIVVLVLVVILLAGAAHAATIDAKVGKMGLSFMGGAGFALSYDGVSLIKESTFWVHDPSWREHYYGYPVSGQEVSSKDIEGGKELIIKHKSSSFEGRHRITMLENKISFELTYKLLANVDGDMEYCLGYVNASPITNCPFRAETEDGIVGGVIPIAAKSPKMSESFLTPKPFKSLTIYSRIGTLDIDVTGDPPVLTMFDARKHRVDWAEKHPIFWLGVLGKDLEVGKEYTQTVTLSVKPLEARQHPMAQGEGGAIFPHDVEDLRLPAAGQALVIPEPKEMKRLDGDFPLTAGVKIVLAKGATEEDARGATAFVEEIRELYKLDLPIVKEEVAAGKTGVVLVGEAAKADRISAPDKEEGYALRATPDRVVVIGKDIRGCYWGMQTLRQLVKVTEKGLAIQGCEISDWPSLKFRGVHLFTGKNALPFHEKLIDRIFSRYKLNNLVLECEYMKWKSAPDIALDFAMSQEDARKDIEHAQQHFMDVTPLVNSLGHSEWMFKNGKNLNLAENPSHPYTYCASKPETYDFIFKIYDEAADLFKPKYFHIGHDEVTTSGEYPTCPECKKKSAGDLILGDIQKLHEHLGKKGIKLMMWGDMLLGTDQSPDAHNAPSREEAKRRRDLLPKDIVITDWHYAPGEPKEFNSLRTFMNEGFQDIAATWYTPANIANFAQAAKDANALGLLQTTWAGYDSKEEVLRDSFPQFTAMILAAEYGWNSGKTALEDLPYQPEEEFRHQWDRVPPDVTARKGFVIDLKPAYNVNLADNSEFTGWLGFGPKFDLSMAPRGETRLKGDIFKLASRNDEVSCIRLASSLDSEIDHPVKVDFPVVRKAEKLLFLQTCAWPETTTRQVGTIKVLYTDDKTEGIKLVYGDNIAAWTDGRTCANAPIVWGATTKGGQKVSLRRFEWKNPRPDVTIQSVEFSTLGGESGPTLLAVSGVGAGR